jgi:hypothetical protein
LLTAAWNGDVLAELARFQAENLEPPPGPLLSRFSLGESRARFHQLLPGVHHLLLGCRLVAEQIAHAIEVCLRLPGPA